MALQAESSDPQEVARTTIPKVIRLLLMARGREQRELARYIHLTESQLSDRLAGRTSFKAHEMAGIAAFLDVEPGMLYRSPSTIISASGYNFDSPAWTPTIVEEAGQQVLSLGLEPPALRSVAR